MHPDTRHARLSTTTFATTGASSALAATLALTACGAAPTAPVTGGDVMGKTFAGQKTCNTKHHDRPFVITWDATDQSSFQAHAQSDVGE